MRQLSWLQVATQGEIGLLPVYARRQCRLHGINQLQLAKVWFGGKIIQSLETSKYSGNLCWRFPSVQIAKSETANNIFTPIIPNNFVKTAIYGIEHKVSENPCPLRVKNGEGLNSGRPRIHQSSFSTPGSRLSRIFGGSRLLLNVPQSSNGNTRSNHTDAKQSESDNHQPPSSLYQLLLGRCGAISLITGARRLYWKRAGGRSFWLCGWLCLLGAFSYGMWG